MKARYWMMAIATTQAAFAGSIENMGDVHLKGYLGNRLDAMIKHQIVNRDIDYITAPFAEKTERTERWQSEFWGKYMHSAMPYLEYAGSDKLKSVVERGISSIIASQEPSGYIGNYPDELRCGEGWDVWGMKYTMLGFLHYYDYMARQKTDGSRVKADKALAVCRRLCDYVIDEIGPGGKRGVELWQTGYWSGFASSSILEPVVWLFNRTGEKKYFDFATYIVKGMIVPEAGPRLLDLALKKVPVADRNGYGNKAQTDGEYVIKHNRWKAYEMMSCYQGLIEYWSVLTAKPSLKPKAEWLANADDLLKAAVNSAGDIAREEVNLAGGCAASEAWFHGARKQHLPYIHLQEACVTTTWMRMCEKLLDVTDDPAWADQLEKTFYNAYLASLSADGSEFTAYTPLSGNRWHGMHHCYMHTDCCSANGPRGFLCFLKKFFHVKNGAMTFNFYSSAQAKGKLPDGRPVAFDMYSLYPRSNAARIVSHTEGVGTVPLRLRIPAWSTKATVKLNKQELSGVVAGKYFTINHEWRYGDVIEVEFDMPVVSHTIDYNIAFTRGPVLLARDSRFADGDLMEPFRQGISNKAYMSRFMPVCVPGDEMWMTFSATLPIGVHTVNPEGRNPSTVFFCDYASAGNMQRRDNYYRTWFPIERGVTE